MKGGVFEKAVDQPRDEAGRFAAADAASKKADSASSVADEELDTTASHQEAAQAHREAEGKHREIAEAAAAKVENAPKRRGRLGWLRQPEAGDGGERRDLAEDAKKHGKSADEHDRKAKEHEDRIAELTARDAKRAKKNADLLGVLADAVRDEVVLEEALAKRGTSEGAKLGWESRRGATAEALPEISPKWHQAIDILISDGKKFLAENPASPKGSAKQTAHYFLDHYLNTEVQDGKLKEKKAKKIREVAEHKFQEAFKALDKDLVEKVVRESGFDKLPMTDNGRAIIEDALGRGARPVTEYTGKYSIEHGVPQEPPAFLKPNSLKVGDRVIPLQWVPVGLYGAKFDLPSVPPVARVKKMYVGPAKVTKCAYPSGQGPADLAKCETVTEDRLWALDLEEDGVKKENSAPAPMSMRDTTMVLRLEPLATPEGEVKS